MTDPRKFNESKNTQTTKPTHQNTQHDKQPKNNINLDLI